MPHPTRVFLLRHAESADPTVFHGAESDVDLSDRGRRQAAALVDVLLPRRPDVIVTSNMRRARATAAPLAQALGFEPQIEPLLHERRVGILSGVSVREQDVWPVTLKHWTSGNTAYAHEGAESFDDLRERVLPIWERVVAQHAGRTLVVVVHGIICRVILLSILNDFGPGAWGRVPTPNCGISELIWEKEAWTALSLGRQPDAVRGVD
ncbi:MAG: histidine phosphatase family protein [Gemmataceae bacterium]